MSYLLELNLQQEDKQAALVIVCICVYMFVSMHLCNILYLFGLFFFF